MPPNAHQLPRVADRIVNASRVLSGEHKRLWSAMRFHDRTPKDGCCASPRRLGEELGRTARAVGTLRRQLKALTLASNHDRKGYSDAWHAHLPAGVLPCTNSHARVLEAAAKLDAFLRARVAELGTAHGTQPERD